MYADGNMTLKVATLKAELLRALPGKMFLRISYALSAELARMNSLQNSLFGPQITFV